MTRMRSQSDISSSRSAETTKTARPSSRIATSSRWIDSIAPMSTPCDGCSAMISRASRVSSRASWTFCWLPPESAPAGVVLACAAHIECADQLAASAPRRRGGQERAPAEARQMADRHVLPDRALQRQPDMGRDRPAHRRGPRRATRKGSPAGRRGAADRDPARRRGGGCRRCSRRVRPARCPARPRGRRSRRAGPQGQIVDRERAPVAAHAEAVGCRAPARRCGPAPASWRRAAAPLRPTIWLAICSAVTPLLSCVATMRPWRITEMRSEPRAPRAACG